MKTLDSIQKTCGVFKTLAKIATILSFIWAGMSLFGVLAALVWHFDGEIVGVPMDEVLELMKSGDLYQMMGVLLGDFVLAMTDAYLFLSAMLYFKRELADGTPFTVSGADQVRNLGIKTIVMPLVAIIIAAVIYECFGVTNYGSRDNGAAVVFGVALILVSLILRHGAELRDGNGSTSEK